MRSPPRRRSGSPWPLVAAGLVTLVAMAGTAPLLRARFVRDVVVFNGLSWPVEVSIAGQRWVVAPGRQEGGRVIALDEALEAVASDVHASDGEFETVKLEPVPRPVYNVLGAALLVAQPEGGAAERPLTGTTGALEPGETLRARSRDWRQRIHEDADRGAWLDAGSQARKVALVRREVEDAREMSVRFFLRERNVGALRAKEFAGVLVARWPDWHAQELEQDLLLHLGQREEALSTARFGWDATKNPRVALRVARATELVNRSAAYRQAFTRFPEDTEVRRALARSLLEDEGDARGAVELLAPLLEEGELPHRLEDLEVHVRALLGVDKPAAAAKLIYRYGQDVRRRTWGFLVLAGCVADVAGPARTPYVLRDWLASSREDSPARRLELGLLTGQWPPKLADLSALGGTSDRQVLELLRLVRLDPAHTLHAAEEAPDSVLSRLPPDVLALLALERRDARARGIPDALFGANVHLLFAREVLVDYVTTGNATRAFRALLPGLRTAAHIVRARGLAPGSGLLAPEMEQAVAADPLHGLVWQSARAWLAEKRVALAADLESRATAPRE